MQKKLYFATFFLSAVLFSVLTHLAYVDITHPLYDVFWWYDIVMHGLGGFLVGYIAMWIVWEPLGVFLKRERDRVIGIILLTLFVGICWEFLEYFDGLYAGVPGIVLDTIKDLIMDVTGGTLASLVMLRFLQKKI